MSWSIVNWPISVGSRDRAFDCKKIPVADLRREGARDAVRGEVEVALHGRHEADLRREGARDAVIAEAEHALHGRHEADLRREGAIEPVTIQSQRIHTSKTIARHTKPGAVGVI